MTTTTTIPRYKSVKFVNAFKIGSVGITEQRFGAPWLLTPEDTDISSVEVSGDFMAIHQPQPGGYYIIVDGRPSYKIATLFEQEYTAA